MIRAKLLILAALSVAIAGCAPKENTDAFGERVHAYLMQHPEVIEEAYAQAQKQKEIKALADSRGAIQKRRADLENDPRDFVANPQGKITVVEFFDYRCPYCKAALPQLMQLITQDKNIRFVFKEFPILDKEGTPGVSKRASLAAIAAKDQGKYLQIHNAMMGSRPLEDAQIVRALNANGMNAAALKDSPAADKQLDDTLNLGVAIGVTGTPAFVVGDKLISGADMPALSAAINEARKAKS